MRIPQIQSHSSLTAKYDMRLLLVGYSEHSTKLFLRHQRVSLMLQATDPRCAILLWLFLVSFASSSSSAPAPPASGTSPTNDPVPTYCCTTRADWSAQDLDPNDCGMAMTRFFVDDLLIYGDTSYEFLSNGVHSRTQFPVRYVPRKYAYGKLINELEWLLG